MLLISKCTNEAFQLAVRMLFGKSPSFSHRVSHDLGPPFFNRGPSYDAVFFCTIGVGTDLKLAIAGTTHGDVTTYIPIGNTKTDDFVPLQMSPRDMVEAAHFLKRFDDTAVIEMYLSKDAWSLQVERTLTVLPQRLEIEVKAIPWRKIHTDIKADAGGEVSFPKVGLCFKKLFMRTFFAVGNVNKNVSALRVENGPDSAIRMVATDGNVLAIASRHALEPKKLGKLDEEKRAVHIHEAAVRAMWNILRAKTPTRARFILSGSQYVVEIDDCQIHSAAYTGVFPDYTELAEKYSKQAMKSLFTVTNTPDFTSFMKALHGSVEMAIEVTEKKLYVATRINTLGVVYDLGHSAVFDIVWKGTPRRHKAFFRVSCLRDTWLSLGMDAWFGFGGGVLDAGCLYARDNCTVAMVMPMRDEVEEMEKRIAAMKAREEDT